MHINNLSRLTFLFFFLIIAHAFLLVYFPSHAQKVESFKTDDGETLHYTKKGKGPHVILLYGGPGMSANVMLPWLDSLSNQFECILFEQRGTGLSKNVKIDSTTINVDRACRDLDNLRTHLGDKSLALCGYAWGGMLSMAYAAKYPSRVNNMILVSTAFLDLSLIQAWRDDTYRDTYPNERDSIAYWSKPEIRNQDPVKADLMRMVLSLMNRFYDHDLGRKMLVDYLKKMDVNREMSSLMWNDVYRGFDLKQQLKSYKGKCTNIRPQQDNIPEELA